MPGHDFPPLRLTQPLLQSVTPNDITSTKGCAPILDVFTPFSVGRQARKYLERRHPSLFLSQCFFSCRYKKDGMRCVSIIYNQLQKVENIWVTWIQRPCGCWLFYSEKIHFLFPQGINSEVLERAVMRQPGPSITASLICGFLPVVIFRSSMSFTR